MRTTARTALPPAALVGCVLAGLSPLWGCGTPPRAARLHREIRTLTETHLPGRGIEVRTRNGFVEVRGGDAARGEAARGEAARGEGARGEGARVAVTARLRTRTPERGAATRTLVGRRADGTLLVRVRWPQDRPWPGEGCSFEIVVPDADGVTVRTTGGAIRIAGLRGEADLETESGRVEVLGHEGRVRVRTGGGAIELAGIRGEVAARTSRGSVTLEPAPGSGGEIRMETGTGRIRVERSAGRVRIVENGPKRETVVLQGTGGVSTLETGAGDILLRIPPPGAG